MKLRKLRGRSSRAVSVLELLICLAIIAILTLISLAYHGGALDASDIRYVMPKVKAVLRSMQGLTDSLGAKTTAEFIDGEPIIKITIQKGDPVEPTELDAEVLSTSRQQEMSMVIEKLRHHIEKNGEPYHYVATWDLKNAGLIKRKLVFMDYEWPEGEDEPRTFTWLPNTAPQGGSVEFGTLLAKCIISLDNGAVNWNIE